MALSAPIGSDGYHLFGVTFDSGVDSLHSKKRIALWFGRMPTGLFYGSVRKVRHKSVLHFPVTIWAISRCHLALHNLDDLVDVIDTCNSPARRHETHL